MADDLRRRGQAALAEARSVSAEHHDTERMRLQRAACVLEDLAQGRPPTELRPRGRGWQRATT
eukprot:13621117-Alexandrium_andersonii.AAC.1